MGIPVLLLILKGKFSVFNHYIHSLWDFGFCCKISLLADYHICEEVGIRRTLSRREVEPDMDLSLWGGGEDLHCGVQRVLRGAGDDVQRTRRGHHLQDAVP